MGPQVLREVALRARAALQAQLVVGQQDPAVHRVQLALLALQDQPEAEQRGRLDQADQRDQERLVLADHKEPQV